MAVAQPLEPVQRFRAARDLVRQTALALAVAADTGDALAAIAEILHRHLNAASVSIAFDDPAAPRRTFPFAASFSRAQHVMADIRFGNKTLGTLSVTVDASEDPEEVALLLESTALSLGARLHDADERRDFDEMRALALTDGLTGLANRRAFDETLVREWQRCARSGTWLSVLLFDVDFFKAFNDTYGHLAGDGCLRQVGQAIAGCVRRPGDVAARYGGEEFVVVLPETEPANACAVGETIAEAIRSLAIAHEGSTLGVVSVSVGCAGALPDPAGDPRSLVRAADAQLYRAKELGRNRVVSDSSSSATPVAERRTVVRHNIAPARTSFVGRCREREQLREILGAHRVVSLVGPGGVGKTRLAREAAVSLAERYAAGVWFVDLEGVEESPDAVAGAIVRSAFPEMAADATVAIAPRVFADKTTLLVLDNADAALDALVPVLDAVIDAAPGVTVLITSREPIGIVGERVFRLDPLPAVDAAKLFAQRAIASGADGDAIESEQCAIDAIVADLDGLPLGIEIAATYAATSRPGELRKTIAERIAYLDAKSRTFSSRHRSLDAVLSWSFDRLPSGAQRLFSRLAIFDGGWLREQAIAVCAFGELDVPTVTNALDVLVQKSLAVRNADGRYGFLQPMRAYASEKLRALPEVDEVRDRHAQFFLADARTMSARLGESPTALDDLARPEIPNYLAVLRQFDAQGRVEEFAEIVWSLRYLAFDFSVEFRPYRERLLVNAERAQTPLSLARLLYAHAVSAEKTESDNALAAARRAQAIFTECGDALGAAYATMIAEVTSMTVTGNSVVSEELASAARIASAENGRWLLCRLLTRDGIAHGASGDVPGSVQMLLKAQKAAPAWDITGRTTALGNLAVAYMFLGDYVASKKVSTQVVALVQERRPWRAVRLMINLALACVLDADVSGAREALTQIFDAIALYPSDFYLRQVLDVAALFAESTGNDDAALTILAARESGDIAAQRQEQDQAMIDAMRVRIRSRLGEFECLRIASEGERLAPPEAVALARMI